MRTVFDIIKTKPPIAVPSMRTFREEESTP
jgi:hypothetical protein